MNPPVSQPLVEYKSEVFNEDCYDTLQRLQNGSVNLLLQDTPFGCTQNEWDIKPDLDKMWPEWLRVTADDAAIIFFATQPFASELILSQPKIFRYDLIWYKALGSGFLNAKKMPLRNHEHILVFYRSLPTYNPQMGVGIRKKGIRKHDRTGTNYGKFATQEKADYFDDKGKRYPQSVIDFSNGNKTTDSDHPTQKPIDLIRYLILTYSNPKDLVFDGYMGSGTTRVAALNEGRNFIGSELNTDYFNASEERYQRFQENVRQLNMFQ